jgi:hypothetical protein
MTMNICIRCRQPHGDQPVIYGLHQKCFLGWFKLNQPAEFSGLVRQSAESKDPAAEKSIRSFNSSFFHGKFRKYSADLAGESYILKVRDSSAQELPEVEFLCNQIGTMLGLPIADYYLIEFEGDRTFVTKNFIRRGMGVSNLTHIYHYLKDENYTCESILNILQSETKRPYDLEVFIHTCLYDALIGNHDRHGRNLGLVVTHQRTSLSPIYDNTSYLGLETGQFLNADFNPSGKIYTSEATEPSMKDYVKEFKGRGYSEQVKAFSQKVHPEKIINLISESFCTENMKNAMKRLIEKRIGTR